MSRIFEVPTKPWDDYKLYNHTTITINPGVTVLTGCNGTGKSTLMRLMKEQLERENRSVPAEITERARIKLLFLD